MPTIMLQRQRYLNSERFKAEVAAAGFGVFWGGWVLWTLLSGDDPLTWFPGNEASHTKMSLFLIAVSIIHGLAVKGNGRLGAFSPALRFLCLSTFAGFFWVLAMASATTGFPTYLAIAAAFAYSTRGALGDLKLALKGYRYA